MVMSDKHQACLEWDLEWEEHFSNRIFKGQLPEILIIKPWR